MSIDVCASGMTAQRIRLSVLANNIANARPEPPKGGPFVLAMRCSKRFQERLRRAVSPGRWTR